VDICGNFCVFEFGGGIDAIVERKTVGTICLLEDGFFDIVDVVAFIYVGPDIDEPSCVFGDLIFACDVACNANADGCTFSSLRAAE